MQLDGPDLEELLIRAREEYGSTVRIVAADKIRSGGLGGFFSKENFQLTVELDDGSDDSPAWTSPASAASLAPAPNHVSSAPETRVDRIGDLLAERSQARAIPMPAVDTFTPSVPPRYVPSSTSSIIAMNTETPSLDSLAEQAAANRPVSLLDLADAISDRETYEPRRIRVDGPPAAAQPIEAPRPAPISGSISTGPAVSTEGASFASILAGLTESVSEPAAAARVEHATHRYEEEADAYDLGRPTIIESDERSVSMRMAGHRAGMAVATESSRRSLTDLGVPNALLPSGYDGDLLSALVTALRALPPLPKPPQRPGDVFAVVGDGQGAWDAGVQLALSMGLDERAVFLVSQSNAQARVPVARRLGSIEQIEGKLERWHHKSTATIVVVDAPMTPAAAEWNREVLDTLEPTASWLVVPATRKTNDVAEWAKRLGPADGLVITEVAASRDPASVLCLGIPVAWLDGRPATAGAWAGLLVERLVEAA
jgi:hypothetical protein